ncbi:TPA: Eaa protein, partial [Escherichia coli]|nr:Eaa protein [Escherichia coli]
MTTITDKKQYPSEQYLNELITNIEFAARAPVEVVRAMAAELQKRREADSAEPASNHEELPLDYLQGQKDGLEWAAQLAEANHPQTGDWLYDDPLELAKAIRKGPDMPEFDGPTPVT